MSSSNSTTVPESSKTVSVCFQCRKVLDFNRPIVGGTNIYCSHACVFTAMGEYMQSIAKKEGKGESTYSEILSTTQGQKKPKDLGERRYAALSVVGKLRGGDYVQGLTVEKLKEIKEALYAEGCDDILNESDVGQLLHNLEACLSRKSGSGAGE